MDCFTCFHMKIGAVLTEPGLLFPSRLAMSLLMCNHGNSTSQASSGRHSSSAYSPSESQQTFPQLPLVHRTSYHEMTFHAGTLHFLMLSFVACGVMSELYFDATSTRHTRSLMMGIKRNDICVCYHNLIIAFWIKFTCTDEFSYNILCVA